MVFCSVLYVQESLEASPEVFIDPNEWSDDGTIALGRCTFSENGEYCAYGISKSGSDWRTIKVNSRSPLFQIMFLSCQVKCVASREDMSDVLEWVKFSSIAWTHDDKGFFYQVSRGNLFILHFHC